MSASRPASSGRQAQVIVIKAQKVEGYKRGLRPAALGLERAKIAAAALTQRHCFIIEERAVTS